MLCGTHCSESLRARVLNNRGKSCGRSIGCQQSYKFIIDTGYIMLFARMLCASYGAVLDERPPQFAENLYSFHLVCTHNFGYTITLYSEALLGFSNARKCAYSPRIESHIGAPGE